MAAAFLPQLPKVSMPFLIAERIASYLCSRTKEKESDFLLARRQAPRKAVMLTAVQSLRRRIPRGAAALDCCENRSFPFAVRRAAMKSHPFTARHPHFAKR
jgi:hypothetical protein